MKVIKIFNEIDFSSISFRKKIAVSVLAILVDLTVPVLFVQWHLLFGTAPSLLGVVIFVVLCAILWCISIPFVLFAE